MSHSFQDYSGTTQSTTDLDAGLPTEGVDFERGTWRGLDRFQCLHCPWDTTYPERIIDHFLQRHKPKPPITERPAEATLYDGDGKLVERIPVPSKSR